ncbi:hypothetical protein CDAR_316601 [Caerostris darwini]|uniref:Uncharacterized protein n=1 Tax=Caerostris darwini TaxID=1538125 RepID=A0AAV4UJA8_9ARAC|nr:hypothetical protein CDAR_316601 [Caerostris darwini]
MTTREFALETKQKTMQFEKPYLNKPLTLNPNRQSITGHPQHNTKATLRKGESQIMGKVNTEIRRAFDWSIRKQSRDRRRESKGRAGAGNSSR